MTSNHTVRRTTDWVSLIFSFIMFVVCGVLIWGALDLPGTTGIGTFHQRLFMGLFGLMGILMAVCATPMVRRRVWLATSIAALALCCMVGSYWAFEVAANEHFGSPQPLHALVRSFL